LEAGGLWQAQCSNGTGPVTVAMRENGLIIGLKPLSTRFIFLKTVPPMEIRPHSVFSGINTEFYFFNLLNKD